METSCECANVLETFTCILVKKAEERAAGRGDESGCSGFYILQGSCDFVVSLVGVLSEESPLVSVGKARERLSSSRVSMKNDKKNQDNRGEGSLLRLHGLGSSQYIMDVLPGDLAVPLGMVLPLPPLSLI